MGCDDPAVWQQVAGVLEHNHAWSKVLENAVASFTERMALIIFTPPATETHQIGYVEEIGVPDIAFAREDLEAHFDGCTWTVDTLTTSTFYRTETVIYLER